LELLQDFSIKNGPPIATLTKRAKSYSDFYDVCTSLFSQDASKKVPVDTSVNFQDEEKDLFCGNQIGDFERELLEASQEEYQYGLRL